MERDEALTGGGRRPGSARAAGDGPPGSAAGGGWHRAAIGAVARRPHLWLTALVQIGVMAPPGWWRHWPPLPLPDPEYLAFRLQTQYGDRDRAPEPDDLVTYLEWCRRFRRSMG